MFFVWNSDLSGCLVLFSLNLATIPLGHMREMVSLKSLPGTEDTKPSGKQCESRGPFEDGVGAESETTGPGKYSSRRSHLLLRPFIHVMSSGSV